MLIGHSFGGVTVRLLSELLAHGCEEERSATASGDLSPLFAGGMGQRIQGIVTLAAPTNGTTAYDLAADPTFDVRRVRVPLKYRLMDCLVKSRTRIKTDGRDARDYANYDMLLDNAQAQNARIATLPHVFYVSVACDATQERPEGTRVPDLSLAGPLFVCSSLLMEHYTGTTKAAVWSTRPGMPTTVWSTPSRRALPLAHRRSRLTASTSSGVYGMSCPTCVPITATSREVFFGQRTRTPSLMTCDSCC